MDCVNRFNFIGRINSSKSIYNRALIAKSFFKDLEIIGNSNSEDVINLSNSLKSLENNETEFFCGDGGTTLRFLALRLSREKGSFIIKGSQRLFERPQQGLVKILGQLGVVAELGKDFIKINSKGWRLHGDGIFVDTSQSSQFLSSLVLSSWNFDKDIHFVAESYITSKSYFEMTIKVLKQLGMTIEFNGKEGVIKKMQSLKMPKYAVEQDLSSCFSIAALGALSGQVIVSDFPDISIQPDIAFLEILNKMEAKVEVLNATLKVKKNNLKAITHSIEKTPDLFPVLSVLCAFADGESEIFGASQLVHKESDRILKTKELLSKIGIETRPTSGGLVIKGRPNNNLSDYEFTYDPDKDHRMAMAAGLLIYMGAKINLLDKEVVNKSFPKFWDCLGLQ